jgi:flagellar basal-body rod protein FlgF
MNSGLYAACTALVSRTEALDTLANNMANVSTAGFRGRQNVFSSILAAKGGNANISMLNQDANDYGVLSGTRLDTTQGSLQHTGNDLDVAIQGQGYLTVKTSAGLAYTRGGSLQVSPQGQLITAAGDPVLGDTGLPINIIGTPVSISEDGTISTKGAITGRLKLVEFPATVNLQSTGGSYYTAPAGMKPTASPNSVVHQGMIEASNVNPLTSVVDLISAQREVETMRRALSLFSSEMDKTAAQDLPHVS